MAELPPLDVRVEGDDRYDYIMRREKNIRKGTFQKKLGRLVVQSAQPQSLKLPYARGPNVDCTPTTMATLNVRFDPVDESSPLPSLNTLQAKLKVATCFASVPMDEIPTKSSDFHCSSVRGIFVESLNLSSLCLSKIEWDKQTPSTDLSNPRNSRIPNPSKAYNGGSYYTAKVAVPVSLSKGNKVLVPSFHSCLVSRMYALDLYLSLSTPGTTVTDPTIQLKLPLQVSSEGNPNATPIISAQVCLDPSYEGLMSELGPLDQTLTLVNFTGTGCNCSKRSKRLLGPSERRASSPGVHRTCSRRPSTPRNGQCHAR